MKLLKTALIATAFATFTAAQSMAQITVVPENDQFSLKLIGRTNLDAGTYFNRIDTDHPDNGVAVNDTRLGVAGKFLEKWDYKIELAFVYSKNANTGAPDATTISFRDVFIKYNFNSKHHIQFGNVFMGYGMKPLGLAYKFIDDATVDNSLCPSRKMGLVYLLTTDHFNFNGGVYSDGNVDKGNAQFDKGVIFSAKAIYRPIINDATVLHFGLAPMYVNSPNAGSFSSNIPQTFSNKKVGLDKLTFNADHYSRYEAEMIFIHKRFLLETHFQGASCEPHGTCDRYHMGGFLAQTSFLLIGEQQNYNKTTGLAANASPKNLEILARYDYLDLHSNGNQSDLTIGLNYFFSKHFNMKLNYGVTQFHLGDAHETYNTLQLRAQFSF